MNNNVVDVHTRAMIQKGGGGWEHAADGKRKKEYRTKATSHSSQGSCPCDWEGR